MATWNTRGLRGSTLEDMVNRTNEKYAEAGLVDTEDSYSYYPHQNG